MRRTPALPAPPPGAAPSRPICYLAVQNVQTRTDVEAELVRLGWHVVARPTGFHLLEELSGWILGDAPKPIDLVVVEDCLPGCRGSSIARGLQELGVEIPIVVIDAGSPELAPLECDRVFVFDPAIAAAGITAIARHRYPTATAGAFA